MPRSTLHGTPQIGGFIRDWRRSSLPAFWAGRPSRRSPMSWRKTDASPQVPGDDGSRARRRTAPDRRSRPRARSQRCGQRTHRHVGRESVRLLHGRQRGRPARPGERQLPELRGRALAGREPDEPSQSRWRLPAGPLERWRLARHRGQRDQGRWLDLDAGADSWREQVRGRVVRPRDRPVAELRPDGTLWLVSQVFNVFDAKTGMLVSKSTDGGSTWEAPVDVSPRRVRRAAVSVRRQGRDHRRSERPEPRVRGLGPRPDPDELGKATERQLQVLGFEPAHPARANDRWRQDLGAGARPLQPRREQLHDLQPDRRPPRRHARRQHV